MEEMRDIEELKGDVSAHNNQRQLNARTLISRKSEVLRAQPHGDSGEEMEGVDDGIPDEDPTGGVSDSFMVTDETVKIAMQQQPAQEAAPAKHKIKVNGQEMELTTEELIARAQKIESADQYLAASKREAEALLASARQVEAPSQVDAPSPEEEYRELARKIQVGSEDEAANAIARLATQRPSPSTYNVDEVAARTIDRIHFEEDFKWFSETYKDVFQDPNLKALAIQKDDELRRAGDVRRYRDRYQEIGEDIRKWIGSSPAFTEKKEQKAQTLKSIPQASVRSQRPPEEEEDDSPASVIAQMAKQRGQLRI
jgi:hypothetical protein